MTQPSSQPSGKPVCGATKARQAHGYVRVAQPEGEQGLQHQRRALLAAGVATDALHVDVVCGNGSELPGLRRCFAALRPGHVLVVCNLSRLGRDLKGLIDLMLELRRRRVDLLVLEWPGEPLDTSRTGENVFELFVGLREFQEQLVREQRLAALAAARTRGRKGGRPRALSEAQVRRAQVAMRSRQTDVRGLCAELGITKTTLYRYVGPRGELRRRGKEALGLATECER